MNDGIWGCIRRKPSIHLRQQCTTIMENALAFLPDHSRDCLQRTWLRRRRPATYTAQFWLEDFRDDADKSAAGKYRDTLQVASNARPEMSSRSASWAGHTVRTWAEHDTCGNGLGNAGSDHREDEGRDGEEVHVRGKGVETARGFSRIFESASRYAAPGIGIRDVLVHIDFRINIQRHTPSIDFLTLSFQ